MFRKLEGQMVEHGISDKMIADRLGIAVRTFKNKTKGISEFTWSEVCIIQGEFFPAITKDELFTRSDA
jgi:hypothetical protein